MELDSRIKEGKRPLTCIDIEQAREFVGKQCLFSDSYNNFVDIGKYAKNTQYIANLSIEENPTTHDEYVFINNYDGYRYRLALPLEWIEQGPGNKIDFKKYTLDTWQQEFKPGDVIIFTEKEDTSDEGNYFKFLYSGYVKHPDNCIRVVLGPWLFSFEELLTYKINRDGTWEPFGKKVNEGKK